MTDKEAIELITAELDRARKINTFWPLSLFGGLNVLTEEFLELSQAANDLGVKHEEPGLIAREAVQLGAMCVRFLVDSEDLKNISLSDQMAAATSALMVKAFVHGIPCDTRVRDMWTATRLFEMYRNNAITLNCDACYIYDGTRIVESWSDGYNAYLESAAAQHDPDFD